MDKEEYEKLRIKAGGLTSYAIKKGEIPKLDGKIKCTDCGKPATCYDHRNYYKPLEVEPVCKSCNNKHGAAYPFPDNWGKNLNELWGGVNGTGEGFGTFSGECHCWLDEDLIDNHIDYCYLETDKDLITGLRELAKYPVKKYSERANGGLRYTINGKRNWPWW